MVQKQGGSGYRDILRPSATAGTRNEQMITLGCLLALIAIFSLELMTPNDVVGATALLPLGAGVWMLSNRMAAVVVVACVVFFAIAVLLEVRNRPTLLLVAIPVLISAGFVRLLAASVLAQRGTDEGQESRTATLPAVPHNKREYRYPALTYREREVARLAARAYTAAEIGCQLHIGERTVESHIASAYVKLGIRSRPELIRLASALG
jgi:DNA-binding CsgD family transcriptional regulator